MVMDDLRCSKFILHKKIKINRLHTHLLQRFDTPVYPNILKQKIGHSTTLYTPPNNAHLIFAKHAHNVNDAQHTPVENSPPKILLTSLKRGFGKIP